MYRGGSVELSEECARWAVHYRDRGIVGLGLGGAERATPAAPYAKAFAIAREGGLAIVPHAGESDGPASIREVLGLEPDRIRHGIRAVEDAGVLTEIADRGLVLDVCLTSNLRTNVVPALDQHPLPKLRAAGIPCSINTDDPAMFGTDLAHEHELAAQLGITAADAFQAGLAGARCDEPTRAILASLINGIG
jgi:aminodeoxyfutalosine deaminase